MANTRPHLKRLRCVFCPCVSLPTNVKSTNPTTKRPKYKFRQKNPTNSLHPTISYQYHFIHHIHTNNTFKAQVFNCSLFHSIINTEGLGFLAQTQHPSPLSPPYFSSQELSSSLCFVFSFFFFMLHLDLIFFIFQIS